MRFKPDERRLKMCRTDHFISENEQIEFLRKLCNVLQLPSCEDFADRVVRCIHDDHLCFRSDCATMARRFNMRFINEGDILPKCIKVEGPVVAGRGSHVMGWRLEWYKDRYTTVECDGRKILVKERLKHNDFVPIL